MASAHPLTISTVIRVEAEEKEPRDPISFKLYVPILDTEFVYIVIFGVRGSKVKIDESMSVLSEFSKE